MPVSKIALPSITKFALLSVATAIVTIGLKTLAYRLTNSVGLLSDAMESVVNLAAAVLAFLMLKLAEKPPDEDHAYGHFKAEYFASFFEGTLIILAAAGISIAAVKRMIDPQALSLSGLGLFMSLAATLINFIVAQILLNAGKKYRSLTLEADGKHLLTDVWTSVGVFVALILIMLTKIRILDPLIALAVAGNIMVSGFQIVRKSFLGFMDTAISLEDRASIQQILNRYRQRGLVFHSLRTRQSGRRKFMSVHVLVPGRWSTQKGHDVLEQIETKIRDKIDTITVFTHLEPKEDRKSWLDTDLDR